jgi:hypothetical protein
MMAKSVRVWPIWRSVKGSSGMRSVCQKMVEARAAGQYKHEDMGRSYDRIGIVTIREIVEEQKRLQIPMSLEVLRKAARADHSEQMELV